MALTAEALQFYYGLQQFVTEENESCDAAIVELVRDSTDMEEEQSKCDTIVESVNTLVSANRFQTKYQAQPHLVSLLAAHPVIVHNYGEYKPAPIDIYGNPQLFPNDIALTLNRSLEGKFPNRMMFRKSKYSHNDDKERCIYTHDKIICKYIQEDDSLHEAFIGLLSNSMYIQEITTAFFDDQSVYIIMPVTSINCAEFVRIQTIRQQKPRYGTTMFFHILKGLYYLNSVHNIVHCDIKPNNILVSMDTMSFKLCDFGSALPPDTPSVFLGTLPYVPPEILRLYVNEPSKSFDEVPVRVTFKTDVWALAVVLYEFITGKEYCKFITGSHNYRAFNSILQNHEAVMMRYKGMTQQATVYEMLFKLCLREEIDRKTPEQLLRLFNEFHSFYQMEQFYTEYKDGATEFEFYRKNSTEIASPINQLVKVHKYSQWLKKAQTNRCAHSIKGCIQLINRATDNVKNLRTMYHVFDAATISKDSTNVFVPLEGDFPDIMIKPNMLPGQNVFANINYEVLKNSNVQYTPTVNRIVTRAIKCEDTDILPPITDDYYPITVDRKCCDLQWLRNGEPMTGNMCYMNLKTTSEYTPPRTVMLVKDTPHIELCNYSGKAQLKNYPLVHTFNGVSIYSSDQDHIYAVKVKHRSPGEILSMLAKILKIPNNKHILPCYGFILHKKPTYTLIALPCPGGIKKPAMYAKLNDPDLPLTNAQAITLKEAAEAIHSMGEPMYAPSKFMLQKYRKRLVFNYPLAVLLVIGDYIRWNRRPRSVIAMIDDENNQLGLSNAKPPPYKVSPRDYDDCFPLGHLMLANKKYESHVVGARAFNSIN
uniref:mitogen-activated protein kinase kinase n=1 Tax=Ranid herpesvirus 4 TaxID=2849006 RepID=A0A8F3CIK6_9VIRU|nr:MAG: hypothetical protein [Ranid herpesvirus 4]